MSGPAAGQAVCRVWDVRKRRGSARKRRLAATHGIINIVR